MPYADRAALTTVEEFCRCNGLADFDDKICCSDVCDVSAIVIRAESKDDTVRTQQLIKLLHKARSPHAARSSRLSRCSHTFRNQAEGSFLQKKGCIEALVS